MAGGRTAWRRAGTSWRLLHQSCLPVPDGSIAAAAAAAAGAAAAASLRQLPPHRRSSSVVACEGPATDQNKSDRAKLWGFSTGAIHVGQEPDPRTGAVTPPIVLATTFAQASPGVSRGFDVDSSYGEGFEYARTANPTRGQFEICLAACENGRHCIAFGSGMAAIGAVVQGVLVPGDNCIMVDDAYGGTQRLFRHCTRHMGISFNLIDVGNLTVLEEVLRSSPSTKMIWIESPTNPTLKICDIQAISDLGRKYGCLTVVDNTFASPALQNPLDLGADVVVHSVTKYIGGHSDVMCGAVVVREDELAAKIRHVQNSFGGVPNPFDCYLAARGLKTLQVRMAEHNRNARAVAEFLEAHPKVEKVIYPGLASHPQHALAAKQMRGFGGVVTFYLRGDLSDTRVFLESLHLFACAESLGAVESLAEAPAVMTHQSVPAEHRAAMGISDNLIRLSVGLESFEDLIDDLSCALRAVGDQQQAET